MPHVSLHDLRRVADALAMLKGRTILGASVRSDFRQLKLELSEGVVLVVALENTEAGPPRLEVDLVRHSDQAGGQLEVRFDAV